MILKTDNNRFSKEYTHTHTHPHTQKKKIIDKWSRDSLIFLFCLTDNITQTSCCHWSRLSVQDTMNEISKDLSESIRNFFDKTFIRINSLHQYSVIKVFPWLYFRQFFGYILYYSFKFNKLFAEFFDIFKSSEPLTNQVLPYILL